MKTTACFVLSVLVFSVQACNPLVNDGRIRDKPLSTAQKIANLKKEQQTLLDQLQQQKDDISAKESALEELEEKYDDAKTKLDKLTKHEAGEDVITDEEELETLKEGKTTSDETVKKYKKLEKELKDLKSAELETKNKIAAVTKQLAQLGVTEEEGAESTEKETKTANLKKEQETLEAKLQQQKDDISTKESALEALKEKYEDAKAKLEKLAKHEAGEDVITDEEELETLKAGKTTFDETVKNYEKLEKELKDLKSAELETKNKTVAVTKELDIITKESALKALKEKYDDAKKKFDKLAKHEAATEKGNSEHQTIMDTIAEKLENTDHPEGSANVIYSMILTLQSGQEEEKINAKAKLATFKDAITDDDIAWLLRAVAELRKTAEDLITDDEELETLKREKTTLEETIKNYEKLEKELKDLKSAKPETTENTD